MSPLQTRLFVEPIETISKRCQISEGTAKEININTGELVILTDPNTNKQITCPADVSSEILDFSIKVASDILTQIDFTGIELIVAKASGGIQPSSAPKPTSGFTTMPQRPSTTQTLPQSGYTSTPPKPQVSTPPPKPISQPTPQRPPQSSPEPEIQMPPPPKLPPQPPQTQTPPKITPQPGFSQVPTPKVSPQPQHGFSQVPPPPQSSIPSGMTQPPPGMQHAFDMDQGMGMGDGMGMAPPDPYPDRIDVNSLSQQIPGSLVLNVKKTIGCNGRVKLNPQTITSLRLAHGMLVAWEDPLTRSQGSARITADNIPQFEVHMDLDTTEDTNIQAEQIVLYSTEPPIEFQDEITLEVVSQPGLDGFIMVNPRNAATLQVTEGEVLSFEDNLTGAIGAAKFKIKEDLPNDQVVIDAELIEASGVGSMEVELKKNLRQIIALQSVELGISPITGENVWEIISTARQNINNIKRWLSNYIIFKGIKLRWEAANVACEFLSTIPDLIGDVFATITENTTITLRPTGLVTFNAILIIDISRSMMARDVEVKNIGPALEGIKAAMSAKEIQEFLAKFKPGVLVPRRYSAAFAAILFLSEKVGRGFGEKVSIIRFADEAQVVPFEGGMPYMDSSSGAKDVLENAAKLIVEQIGNAYGQATNLGLAMRKAQEILKTFEALEVNEEEKQPTMIVLLTDGIPTDGNKFFDSVKDFSKNPNVVMYIIGLGNPDDVAMKRAAQLCGGEYFKPEDSGELLIWYSKRARDLQVKMKAHSPSE
ncbi:MAG: VWA domain-containing protein [Candidatus Lokiarchaeota archaeon]|nr:VWA domain-containing protein [Candidatus Lokiarchaeota archaeon]